MGEQYSKEAKKESYKMNITKQKREQDISFIAGK